MEKIMHKCPVGKKLVAERDSEGNIWVICRGCKQKVKIEVKSRVEPRTEKVSGSFSLGNYRQQA